MDSEKNELNALIVTVSIAENECHLVETAGGAIAPILAEQKPTMPESSSKLTLGSAKRQLTVKRCEHCGQEYEAKRPAQSRFCGSRCRRLAWLERNPERAAALAESDRQRLRLHLAGRGIAWQERGQ